jgi:hypothetical protein
MGMPLSGYSWFRMYSEFATDPKIQALAFEDQRHFVALLCLKCNGVLDSHTGSDSFRERMIAVGLGLSDDKRADAKARLLDAGLIDDKWQPLAWDKRQRRSDQDPTNAERQQRYRERNASRNGDVTRLDTDRDTEEETEKREERASKARTAHHLPEDFGLTDERRKVATTEGLDPDRTFSKFRNFWLSASGQRARKRDWDKAWHYWCQNDRGGGKPSTVGKFVPPPDEVANA